MSLQFFKSFFKKKVFFKSFFFFCFICLLLAVFVSFRFPHPGGGQPSYWTAEQGRQLAVQSEGTESGTAKVAAKV